MNCREVQAVIPKYVQEQLDIKTLEAFLQHIKNCPDCKEELEVYDIVFTGIKRLDEDENIAVNYHTEFENKIARSEQRLKYAQTRFNIKRALYGVLCLFAVVLCSIKVGRIETIDEPYKNDGDSTYELPYYFTEGKNNTLDQYVKKR